MQSTGWTRSQVFGVHVFSLGHDEKDGARVVQQVKQLNRFEIIRATDADLHCLHSFVITQLDGWTPRSWVDQQNSLEEVVSPKNKQRLSGAPIGEMGLNSFKKSPNTYRSDLIYSFVVDLLLSGANKPVLLIADLELVSDLETKLGATRGITFYYPKESEKNSTPPLSKAVKQVETPKQSSFLANDSDEELQFGQLGWESD